MDLEFLYTKEYTDLLTREQLELFAKTRCPLTFLRNVAATSKHHALALFSIDQEIENQKNLSRLGAETCISLEDAFDLNNPNCVKHGGYSGYQEYIETLKAEDVRLSELDWHHISPEPEPKWLQEVSKITKLIDIHRQQ